MVTLCCGYTERNWAQMEDTARIIKHHNAQNLRFRTLLKRSKRCWFQTEIYVFQFKAVEVGSLSFLSPS